MGRLNFKDIGDDWTPSAISIVDIPDHPLAVFEVYENDEEFVKKSIDISEVKNMTNKNNNVEVSEDTQMVSGPVGFFDRILDRVVTKSTEPPVGSTPPEKPPEKNKEAVTNEQIMAKLESIDKRVTELEKEKEDTVTKQQEGNVDDPVPGTVTKQQENNNIKTNNNADNNENNDPTKNVVTKSRQVDPDSELVVTKSSKTLMERLGRDENGMTW